MNEQTLAILMLFGFMPLLGAAVAYIRWRRHDDLRRLIQRGADPHAAALPDGKTMIELEKLRLADRDKARALFERLSLEKLELLKVSIQSGYKEEELARLDERLERIIGSDKLQRLLDEGTAAAASARPAAAPAVVQPELSAADLSAAQGGQSAPASQGTTLG